jgi:hypothetical protein
MRTKKSNTMNTFKSVFERQLISILSRFLKISSGLLIKHNHNKVAHKFCRFTQRN